MRIIFFDLDTLRPDHLGCYGYKRNTSPSIDSICQDGVRFDNYYCPNAPCLPSRASLVSGRYGITNGVVGHGGTTADMRIQGVNRSFKDVFSTTSLFQRFRNAGLYTASFSTFAERHSSWWFNCGFNELHNVGLCGDETADMVAPKVLEWLEKNGKKENWFLHINMWDAHTPYRTPADYPNVFENVPLGDDWVDEEEFKKHLAHVGPHSANEIEMYHDRPNLRHPKHPSKLTSLADVKYINDMYDLGIKYMDERIGDILDYLKQNDLYEDTCIIVTSDHGENFGELGIYAEHGTADDATCKIPMIIKWKNGPRGLVDKGFHDNVDLLPTICDLLNLRKHDIYDGESYAQTLIDGTTVDKGSVILTQCAHVCQRAARFGDYIYIRTYHDGYHLFDNEMLFNLTLDPHEKNNIAKENPDICAKGAQLIFEWQNKYMLKSPYTEDPLFVTMHEGGPFHARGELWHYLPRLEATGRKEGADLLRQRHPNEIRK